MKNENNVIKFISAKEVTEVPLAFQLDHAPATEVERDVVQQLQNQGIVVLIRPGKPHERAPLEMSSADLPADLQAIKDRWARATPGPWGWFGHVGHGKDMSTNIRLSSRKNGDSVMIFRRVQKTNAGQPYFQHPDPNKGVMVGARNFAQHEQLYRTHINGINHPDAQAIASAPEDVRVLLHEVDRLRAQVPSWTPITQPPAESGTYLVIMAGFPVVLFYNAEEGFWDDDEQTDALVTHWMPILKTPEDA